MTRVALMFWLMTFSAHADVLICDFTPTACLPGISCDPFRITIDTHHGVDAPMFDYDGTTSPIRLVPDEYAEAPSYVTLGHGAREIVTLFNGFDAIHTRHFTDNTQPIAQTAFGRCTSFY